MKVFLTKLEYFKHFSTDDKINVALYIQTWIMLKFKVNTVLIARLINCSKGTSDKGLKARYKISSTESTNYRIS